MTGSGSACGVSGCGADAYNSYAHFVDAVWWHGGSQVSAQNGGVYISWSVEGGVGLQDANGTPVDPCFSGDCMTLGSGLLASNAGGTGGGTPAGGGGGGMQMSFGGGQAVCKEGRVNVS